MVGLLDKSSGDVTATVMQSGSDDVLRWSESEREERVCVQIDAAVVFVSWYYG